MRGYDKKKLMSFQDDVIKDYGVYIALVKELQEENAKLKATFHQLLLVAHIRKCGQ